MFRDEAAPTSPEPVANRLPTVAELLPCFQEWLAGQHVESNALALLRALGNESAKVAHLTGRGEQLEFNAEDLVQVCWPELVDFDSAKMKVKNAKLEQYLSSRSVDREAFFAQRGLKHSLRLRKRSTSGHHRAQWSLEPYALTPQEETIEPHAASDVSHIGRLEPVGPGDAGPACLRIEYAYAPAGTVKPSWVARPLFGSGSFKTKSLRGLLFASTVMAPMACIALLAAIVWLMLFVNRPVTTADLAFFVCAAGIGWVLWDFVRQLWWLLADRIVPAADVLVRWNEPPAQLESFKQGDARIIGLVRYSATCPVCAATVELRYGAGHERRRLFGCCVEAPQEHVFTFDRVTRQGKTAPR
ncbi:hypothetical protein WKW79_15200 [Variovorax robiniae]|uniref:Uncharacterized protein n=1 Tax=Variovorax robiniae TaxID=1836199 RepID=A0ABU8X7Y3_9BURK